MKKDAYYFPHFSNARSDAKILKIRRIFGIEGYGIYFMLLEVLREQTEFKLPIASIEDIAFEIHVSREKIVSIVYDFDLFEIQDNIFFSPKQILYLQPYIEKSDRARAAALVRWNNANADAKALQMQCNSNASKVNESKVEKECTYSPFYDEQIELSVSNQNYLLLVKWLFGDNIYKRPLEKVLSMKEQLSWKQFDSVLEIHKETGVKIRTLLEELENWLMKTPKAKNSTVLGTLRTFAKRAKQKV